MPSTRRRNAPFARLGAIALLCGIASSPAAAQNSVELTFDWPQPLSGTATFTFDRHQLQGPGEKRMLVQGEMGMTVSAVSDGLLLSFESLGLNVDSEGYPELEGRIAKAMARIMAQPPSYLVSRQGEFLRLSDPAGFAATVQEATMLLLSDLPPQVVQQVEPILAATLSEAQLTSLTAANWNNYVGTWIDGEMVPGEPYHTEDVQDVPMLGAVFPVQLTYTLIGDAPCAAATGCVELEQRSVMQSPEATAAMEGFFGQMLAASGVTDVQVETYRIVASSRIVADPKTLVTYRSSMQRETVIDLVTNGQPVPVRDTERRVLEFAYD